MSMTHRRQQIGTLRALGATRHQIMRLAFGEALLISVIGTLVGLVVAGPLFGYGMIALIRAVGSGMAIFDETGPTAASVGLAILLGLSIAPLAMLFPARAAMRTPPLAALREPEAAAVDRNPTRRAWIGLVLLAALMVYLIIMSPGDWVRYPLDTVIPVMLMAIWVGGLLMIQPAYIGWLGRRAQRLLQARSGATGRLIGDNLRRGRRRVGLTVLALMIGLGAITWSAGFLDFMLIRLIVGTIRMSVDQQAVMVSPFDPTAGWEAIIRSGRTSFYLTDDEMAAIEVAATAGAPNVALMPVHYVVVPELSALGSTYFSFMVDPDLLRRTGDSLVRLSSLDWETAVPIMRSGCGAIVLPAVAERNDVGVGDSLTVTGRHGPVPCRVAAIGQIATGASVISVSARDALGVGGPVVMWVLPGPGSDQALLERNLRALEADFPGLNVVPVALMVGAIEQSIGAILVMEHGLMLVAILTAALGVVNTTVMSVTERRREISLMRSVGATKRQIQAVIMGEAALIGLAGGALGMVAGVGGVLVFVVSYGGRSWGFTLPPWESALASTLPALLAGVTGMLVAPLIAAMAAYVPSRAAARRSPVETRFT